MARELGQPLGAFFSAFDGIYDPQNLGSVIRTAACFSLDAVIIPRDNACSVTDTVTNVARGGTEHVKIGRVTNLARYIEELKKKNITPGKTSKKPTAKEKRQIAAKEKEQREKEAKQIGIAPTGLRNEIADVFQFAYVQAVKTAVAQLVKLL